MSTLRILLQAVLLLFALSGARAAEPPLDEAAARIATLLSAGDLDQAVVAAAVSAKALQADPDALAPAATAGLADAINEVTYRLAAKREVAKALVLIEQVAILRERVLGANHPSLASALNDWGILLTVAGRYADAVVTLERALAIREPLSGAEADVAQTLKNLAQAKKRLGEVAAAEALLRRTATIEERVLGAEAAALGDTLADIADILAANGRATEAEPLALRALAITEQALGPDDPETARRLIKLANVLAAERRLAEAEERFRRALAIREKAFGAESQQVAGLLSNLANVILAEGRPADAEPLLRRALDLQVRLRGAGHPAVGLTLARLADALRDQSRFAEAEAAYGQSLAVLEKAFGAVHPEVAAVLEDLGSFRFREERFIEALDLFRRAGSIVTTREAAGDPVEPDAGVLNRRQGLVFRWIAESGFEIADRDEARRPALATEAYLAIQQFTRSRTGISLDRIAMRIGQSKPTLRDTIRAREGLMKAWQEADAAMVAALGSGAPGAAFAAEMARIETGLAGIDAGIARDFPEFSELFDPKPLTVPETQALLSPDEALVTYSINDSHVLIWVITRDRLVWVHSPIGEARLDELVEKLRSGVATPDADFDLAAAHELYRAILGLDRVEAAIAGKPHLIVIPTAALTSLPFQLLVTEPPPEATDPDRYRKAGWLIRRHALSVLPSVSSLKVLRRVSSADRAALPFIGLGNPVFRQPGEEPAGGGLRAPRPVNDYYRERVPDLAALARGLAELPETADELKAVSATLGADPDSVILRETASEATLKALNRAGMLANFRVVYFATHGLVAGEVEKLLNFRAEPALALSLPAVATPVDDGLLTATEAAELKLNADWIILSACNTAAGDRPGAEALSGLARSFFYAGARSLLVSHWSVNSEAAVTLTTDTFERLAADRGLTRAAALRDAMLAIVDRDRNRSHTHPTYWAPFSIVGDGGPL